MPITIARYDACTPSATALPGCPLPNHRAARAVVPYSTKVPTIASTAISVVPTARAPSARAPR